MNKTLKIITILLMTMVVVLCANTQMVFATEKSLAYLSFLESTSEGISDEQ